MTPPAAEMPPDALLADIERTAVELAKLAGVEIETSLGRELAVRYKTNTDPRRVFADPVSEVDRTVEGLVRARLDSLFPSHSVLGEEMDAKIDEAAEFLWTIDPIDGTTNFINGFPLFVASIGVLYRGRPAVGALWCSTSHALHPGVYHARAGGALCFDGETLNVRTNQAVRRRLGGEPDVSSDAMAPWETRKTGSAALECAFVAAGLLNVARFERPNAWDVAGGIALVRAAGRAVYVRDEAGWSAFADFGADVRTWRRALVIGAEDVARQMIERLGDSL